VGGFRDESTNGWIEFYTGSPRRENNADPTPSRTTNKTLLHKTSPEQAALYRAASGDFPAPILTDTCTLGIGVRHVIEAFCGGDVSRFVSVKVRLSKLVFAALGEDVTTEMWEEKQDHGGRRVLFRMLVNGDGERVKKVVMSQGCVTLKDGARL
jgi:hypothetical protein